MIDDSGLLHEFVLEADAHIAQIETGLLHMEEGLADEDTINDIFRAAHSIKGTASFFELTNIVELAHSIENVFGELREQRIKDSPQMIDTLLLAVDTLKELLLCPLDSDQYDIAENQAALSHLIAKKPAEKTEAATAWDMWNKLTDEEEVLSIDKKAIDEIFSEPPTEASSPKANLPKAKESFTEDSVRVNVGVLNDLLTLAGEMVLRRNQLLRLTEASNGNGQFEPVVKSIDELTTSLQKKIMQTRMQPIAHVFNKFPRIVRDLSRKVDKEVDLKMEGLEVALDRSLIEALVDPLTHLVRNALDHGIEKPNVRQARNKPAVGVLTLRAFQESGRVVVDICDDGAGIDREKVKKCALQKGLITNSEMLGLTQSDVLSLIMRPGFSTADKVTDLSGRGVGMDVVKNNIEKLGGKIEIFSEEEQGTTFRLLLPLTLAIIAAVIIIEDGQSFAIPQANIKELLLVMPDQDKGPKVIKVHNHPMLHLRGRVLPLIRLGSILSQTRKAENIYESITTDKKSLRIVIIKAGDQEYGLVVDKVFDTEEILVKPNQEMVSECGLYSGVTVLGDGKIAMILDAESQNILEKLTFFVPTLCSETTEQKTYEEQYLLLFKCSGSEILGLDLAMVSRVEELDIDKVEKIGSKYYVRFLGQTTRVIRPEYYLPLSRRKNKLAKVYIIMPKFVKYPIGILVEKIYDAVYTHIELDPQGVTGRGLLGSAVIDDKLVTLLNIHELFAEVAPEYLAETKHSIPNAAATHKYTLLLAEDTPFFRKVVKSYLEVAGYHVVTAEDGKEAFAVLQETKVDAVISDIEMPIMTGIELVRAIRADEKLKDLPVVALTSLRGEENKEKGLRAGFDMYEYKLDRIRLLDTIKEVLSSRVIKGVGHDGGNPNCG